jgi:hypothetical protein
MFIGPVYFRYFMCILLLLGRVFWLLFAFIYLAVKIGGFVTYVCGAIRKQVLMFCCFVLLFVFVYISCYICPIISFSVLLREKELYRFFPFGAEAGFYWLG